MEGVHLWTSGVRYAGSWNDAEACFPTSQTLIVGVKLGIFIRGLGSAWVVA